MRINGTLINYYFHCKRQCYLHGNRLNLEDNSEQVKIGKASKIQAAMINSNMRCIEIYSVVGIFIRILINSNMRCCK